MHDIEENAKKAPLNGALYLSKKQHQAANAIGRGGVYGATAAIFLEGNSISWKKNRFLAFFSCA